MWIGMLCLLLTAALLFLPQGLTQSYDRRTLLILGGAGGLALISAIFLITIRKYAYVQPFEDHLRVVTPFLRLKISYRRIRQATCTEIRHLFAMGRNRRLNRTMGKLASLTVIVLDLNGLPLPRAVLRLFLSPLFFPDKTPRLALLVRNWISLSTELESCRTAWLETQH
jgi:hypothetical protein